SASKVGGGGAACCACTGGTGVLYLATAESKSTVEALARISARETCFTSGAGSSSPCEAISSLEVSITLLMMLNINILRIRRRYWLKKKIPNTMKKNANPQMAKATTPQLTSITTDS